MKHKNLTDIEKARIHIKQKIRLRKRKKIKNTILVLICIFFTISIFNPIKFMNFTNHSIKSFFSKSDFPLKSTSGNNKLIQDFNGDLALLSSNDISIVNSNGYSIDKFTHNFNSPLLSINKDRLIIYQESSDYFFTYEKYMDFKKNKIDEKISYADISNDGKIAYVTSSDRYLNEVVILNNKGSEIYRWYSAYEYVTSVRFSDNTNEAYVNCIITNDGILNTVIYRINFSKTKEVMKVSVDNFILIDFVFSSNSFTIIGDSKIIKFSKKGDIIKEISYDNASLLKYYVDGKNIVVATTGLINSNLSNIIIFDTNLKEISSFSCESNLSDIVLKDKYIYMLTDNNIVKYDLDGNKIDNTILDFNINKIIYIKNSLFVISKSYVNKIKF